MLGRRGPRTAYGPDHPGRSPLSAFVVGEKQEPLSLSLKQGRSSEDGEYDHVTGFWASWARSGGRFERRMALGRPRAAALRAAGGSPAGFWGLRRGAHDRQECGETPQDTRRGQPSRLLRSLPRQPPVCDDAARQSQLRVGQEDQPGPTVGLLGVPESGSGPAEVCFIKRIVCSRSNRRQ